MQGTECLPALLCTIKIPLQLEITKKKKKTKNRPANCYLGKFYESLPLTVTVTGSAALPVTLVPRLTGTRQLNTYGNFLTAVKSFSTMKSKQNYHFLTVLTLTAPTRETNLSLRASSKPLVSTSEDENHFFCDTNIKLLVSVLLCLNEYISSNQSQIWTQQATTNKQKCFH